MKQFVIHLGDEQNEGSGSTLSAIGKALGVENVNILATCGTTAFGVCTAILLTHPDDEKTTINVLKKLDVPFSAQDVLIVSLVNKPGSFGLFSQLLYDQGISPLSFYALRLSSSQRFDYAISVQERDYERTKSFLDASGMLKPLNGSY